MPQITDIKPQKKLCHGEPRFNIHLDGKFGFALPAEALAKAGLKIDQRLTDKEIQQLVKENEYDRYYNGVLKFISFRPRSEKELEDWFKKKEVGEETKKMVWKKLQNLGYINDEEFIKWWIEQRTTFRPSGQRLIKMELKQKGISDEIIAKLLNCYIAKDTEIDLAKKAVEKKIHLWQKLPPEKFHREILTFLFRRGFDWETVKDVVDEISQKE